MPFLLELDALNAIYDLLVIIDSKLDSCLNNQQASGTDLSNMYYALLLIAMTLGNEAWIEEELVQMHTDYEA